MAHTLGPWNLETVTTSVGVCHKIGPFGKTRTGRDNHACVYDDCGANLPQWYDQELLANARLIAAAPLGYELAEMVIEASRSTMIPAGQWLNIVAKARELMNKAEGKQ